MNPKLLELAGSFARFAARLATRRILKRTLGNKQRSDDYDEHPTVIHEYNGVYYFRMEDDNLETWYAKDNQGNIVKAHPPAGSKFSGQITLYTDSKGSIYQNTDEGLQLV